MATRPMYERYQKLALIGSGGMAELYLGVQLGDEAFHQLVVIKRIRPDFLGHDQAQRMFVDEARTVARISHPNIVRIHDLRAMDDGLCIAMEYVDGEPLSALLRALARRGERMPCDIACRLMVQACDALHAAHIAVDGQGRPLGLVHRDISPNNLMLDRSGFLKVIDFGIAKSHGQSEQTLPGVVKGKLSYLSPEHLQGGVDARSDVYGLGLVFFELITGRKAIDGRELELAQLMKVVLHQPLPPVSTLLPPVPPAFDAVIARATAKARDARYPSAEALGAAIRRLADDHGGLASAAAVRRWYQVNFPELIEARQALERRVFAEAERMQTGPGVPAAPAPARDPQAVSEAETVLHAVPAPAGAPVGRWLAFSALLLLAVALGVWLGRQPAAEPTLAAGVRLPSGRAQASAPSEAARQPSRVAAMASGPPPAVAPSAAQAPSQAPTPPSVAPSQAEAPPTAAPRPAAPKPAPPPRRVTRRAPTPRPPVEPASAPPAAPPARVASAPAAPVTAAPAPAPPPPKPAAAYASGHGRWSGAQVWRLGCNRCHGRGAPALSPGAHSDRQWRRLLRRHSRHDPHGVLADLYSPAELRAVRRYISAQRAEQSGSGVAGVR